MSEQQWSPERQVREVAAALMSWALMEKDVPIRVAHAFADDLTAAADQMAQEDK